jgi:hypothetical protein
MRMALARTARLARDWRGRPAASPRPHAPAGAGWTVPSSLRKSFIEDLARFGGGLSVPDLLDDHVSGELAPRSPGARYSNDVMPPSA